MHFFSTYASMSFADAVAAAKEALKREEFSILAEIDMRQVLKRHLSVDLRPYLILSACNLPLVHRAIKADDAIGSMLLCDMVIQEHGDSCVDLSLRPILIGEYAAFGTMRTTAPRLSSETTEFGDMLVADLPRRQRFREALLIELRVSARRGIDLTSITRPMPDSCKRSTNSTIVLVEWPMVKKMFVSSLHRTKAHDEPAGDSSAGFQYQKRDLLEKSHDF